MLVSLHTLLLLKLILFYFSLQVVLVGLIRSVKESFTRIDYELDDMTGPPLEVKHFVDNDVR